MSKADTRVDEFQFERTATNGGLLTYRCMALEIVADRSDEFGKGDLEFIEEIVETLNKHFPHMNA